MNTACTCEDVEAEELRLLRALETRMRTPDHWSTSIRSILQDLQQLREHPESLTDPRCPTHGEPND